MLYFKTTRTLPKYEAKFATLRNGYTKNSIYRLIQRLLLQKKEAKERFNFFVDLFFDCFIIDHGAI